MLQLKHSLQINYKAFRIIPKMGSNHTSTQLIVHPEIEMAQSHLIRTAIDADRVDNLILRLDSTSELVSVNNDITCI